MADDRKYMYGHDDGYERLEEPTLRGGYGEAPHESVGRLLQRTREYYGQDLRQIADSLRIRYAYLDAIERGQFDALPGPTYAVGFVRSYASFLELDDDEVVRRFKQEVEGLDRAQQLHFPEPVSEGKVPGGAILLIALLLIAVSYGGWHYMNSQGHSVADLVPAVPERLEAMIGGTEQADISEPEELAAADGDSMADADATDSVSPRPTDREPTAGIQEESAGAEDRAAPEAPSAEAVPPAAAREEPEPPAVALAQPDEAPMEEGEDEIFAPGAEGGEMAAAPEREAERPEPPADGLVSEPQEETMEQATLPSAPEALDAVPPAPEQAEDDGAIPAAPGGRTQGAGGTEAEGRVFGDENADSRIVLRAVQDTWVQVRGGDDSLLLTRVLNPGDVYRVPNRDDLLLHTGNAGGLEIIVDGEQAATLGGAGEVRRNIPLDPEGLRERSM